MLTNHPHSDILILSGHLNRPYPEMPTSGVGNQIRQGASGLALFAVGRRQIWPGTDPAFPFDRRFVTGRDGFQDVIIRTVFPLVVRGIRVNRVHVESSDQGVGVPSVDLVGCVRDATREIGAAQLEGT